MQKANCQETGGDRGESSTSHMTIDIPSYATNILLKPGKPVLTLV
ncbi:MAG TPA: hypothetical protein VKA95_14520 [Nitrososphaeraceae archaeon]|nr:hypothetical protein [Nitrososphaeraceae archaeon]